MRKVFLAWLMLLLPGVLAAQQSMNNDSVIRLVQAGLSEEVIISTINTSPGAYNTSVDGLIALQNAGVGEKVIETIVAKVSGGSPPAAPGPPVVPVTPAANTVPFETTPANTGAVTYGPPAVFPPEARNSRTDGVKQNLGIGMKFMMGDGVTYYGPNVRGWIKNRVGYEFGLLTDSAYESANYYGATVNMSGRMYVINASGLVALANIDAVGLYIRPYVGGGANWATASVTGTISYYDPNYGYLSSNSGETFDKAGGQGIFGAEFTPRAVRRLSFGPEVGYYRIFDSQGWLAGVNVNFYIF